MEFEADHLLVPLGQDFGGDEDAADVLDDLAFRELVQGLVGEGTAAGAEIGQNSGDDALGESAHPRASPFGAGQGVVEGLQLGGYGARVIGEELVEPLLETAGAWARSVQPFGLPAGGAWAPGHAGPGHGRRLAAPTMREIGQCGRTALAWCPTSHDRQHD